jgi:hypothetical protein
MCCNKLDLVGVQGVRWEQVGNVRVGNYIFSMEKEIKIVNWKRDFCTPRNAISS